MIDIFAPLLSAYTAAGTLQSLAGSLQPASDWFKEVGAQHYHWYYAQLLGAPVLSKDELEIVTFVKSRAA